MQFRSFLSKRERRSKVQWARAQPKSEITAWNSNISLQIFWESKFVFRCEWIFARKLLNSWFSGKKMDNYKFEIERKIKRRSFLTERERERHSKFLSERERR